MRQTTTPLSLAKAQCSCWLQLYKNIKNTLLFIYIFLSSPVSEDPVAFKFCRRS